MKLQGLDLSYGFSDREFFNDKLQRFKIFDAKIPLLENAEEYSQLKEMVSSAPIEEFGAYIKRFRNFLRNHNSQETDAVVSVAGVSAMVELISTMIGRVCEEDIGKANYVLEHLSSFVDELNIYINNSSDKDTLKPIYNSLIQKIEELKYKRDGIDEKPIIVTEDDIQSLNIENDTESLQETYFKLLNESITEHSNHFTVAKEFFSEKDPAKIAKMLPKLKQYFELAAQKLNPSTLKTTTILMNYIYHKIIRDVSGLRQFEDMLQYGISVFQDIDRDALSAEDRDIVDQHIAFLKEKSDYVKSRSKKNLTECANYEYNVLVELGLEELEELFPETETMTEGTVTDAVKRGIRKAKFIDKKISRKIDNAVQRVLDDYREARKNDMEDKIIKSTFRASKLLKRLLGSGLIGLLAGPQNAAGAALLYLIVRFAIDKKTETKYKQKLLNDLKEELRIVEEKRNDADREGDNKAKYRLMRLESQLKRSIDKIQYNLKTY